MQHLLRFSAIFIITLKRMLAQRGLVLATTLGLIAAIALSMSIPIYADGVYQKILEVAVAPEERGLSTALQPPFAFLYRYVGEWDGPVKIETLQPAEAYLSGPVMADLGMKAENYIHFLRTENFRLFPADQVSYSSITEPLMYVNFVTMSDFEKNITLTEGRLPEIAPAQSTAPIEVLISDTSATLIGLRAGEEYDTFVARGKLGSKKNVTLRVRIAGVWKPTDPNSLYWFYPVTGFDKSLFIPDATLRGRVLPALENDVIHAAWYWLMDSSQVQSSDVPIILKRIAASRQTAFNMLPKLLLDLSPEKVLQDYQRSAQSLTVYLYAFSLPLLLMIMIFIGLVADMVVSRRRNEIAVLRSRGSTALQLIGMAILESVLLGLFGLLLGAPSAIGVAQFFGRTKSFLDFTAVSNMHTQITLPAVRFGLVTVVIALVALVIPTVSAARHTIVSYKQDRARQSRPPWWKRSGIDFLLLIPAAYGIYLLRQDLPLLPGGKPALSSDPFQNPLLLLVPALTIFALTLVLLRFLPYLMRLVAWLLSFTHSLGMLMAARYLARTASGYSAALILLIMTLSLSTFTATLAQTLDRHAHDQTYYKVGADMNLEERGDYQGMKGGLPGGAPSGGPDLQNTALSTDQTGKWVFLPISEHLKVPGVQAAARVAVTAIRIVAETGEYQAQYYGIDRVDFPKVAFWRRDFASRQLGDLMNDLARTTDGVLVSTSLLSKYNLKPGDNLRIGAYQFDKNHQITLRIVGSFDYFPGWYPQGGPLVVGNLEYFYEQVGGQFPYDVWIKAAPNLGYAQPVLDGVAKLYGSMLRAQVAAGMLNTEQQRPERQGFYGLLSVGFVALALMTVLGFLLYALFSFQRRFIELGMLRAIGLSSAQTLIFLASELAFLFLAGLGAGTGLGVWVSNLFIPHLQIGTDMSALVPPFVVLIDWSAVFQVYVLFAVLFLAALAVLGVMLMRMKIFQAIKLGESV